MNLRSCLIAALLLLPGVPAAAAPAEDGDERLLREAGIASDGPALLRFFRDRVAGGDERDRIAALIKQLGDDSFDQREKASAQLVAIGAKAEAQLREAVKNPPEAEVKQRAELCLREIAKGGTARLPGAAARVLARRKPDGAVTALLAYLPSADGETGREAVADALAALALRDGKPDPALLAALEDKLALKRATAATALARAGAKEQLPALRKLLKDPDAVVRLRVALALAAVRDKEAVPTLVDLLADLPPNQGAEAEEVLRILAGDAAPEVTLGPSETARKAAREAWAAWWKKNADKVDLAKLADGPREFGYTLVVQINLPAAGAGRLSGRVAEFGRDGKVRWQIEGLAGPRDAQMLPNGNVFIFESSGRRLTERTTKGEIVWEKSITAAAGTAGIPLSAQRLANGNVFVAMRGGLLEIDRDGKEVWSYKPTAAGSIYAAHKSRTGEVALVTLNGTCTLLDAKGKETGTFRACRLSTTAGIDLLANGNVLVPDYAQNKVIEFDPKGKAVWEASVERPGSVVRLANGHTLVGSPLATRVVELDRDGKEVWKLSTEGRVYRASRR